MRLQSDEEDATSGCSLSDETANAVGMGRMKQRAAQDRNTGFATKEDSFAATVILTVIAKRSTRKLPKSGPIAAVNKLLFDSK
jgi:hypothetical protein